MKVPTDHVNLVIAASSPTPQRAPLAMSALLALLQNKLERTTVRLAAPGPTAIWKAGAHIVLTVSLDLYQLTEVHPALSVLSATMKRIRNGVCLV